MYTCVKSIYALTDLGKGLTRLVRERSGSSMQCEPPCRSEQASRADQDRLAMSSLEQASRAGQNRLAGAVRVGKPCRSEHASRAGQSR